MRTTIRVMLATLTLVGSMAASPAHGFTLDDILDVATAARDQAAAARNNAAAARDQAVAARDNAAAARDRAIEARDRAADAASKTGDLRNVMQEGLDTLSPEVRAAIAEAVQDLKQGLQEETDGLAAFAPSGGCSQTCEKFRTDLIALLRNTDTLVTALYFATGMDNIVVDSRRLIGLIQVLPGRVLYPLYRALAVETNLFDAGGFIDRLAEAAQHVLVVGQALREQDGPSIQQQALSIQQTGLVLDQELSGCKFTLDHLVQLKVGTTFLTHIAVHLKLAGTVLSAAGETQIHKSAGLDGWAGASLQNNRLKKIGLALQGVGNAVSGFNTAVNVKIRHCAVIRVQAEILSILRPGQRPAR